MTELRLSEQKVAKDKQKIKNAKQKAEDQVKQNEARLTEEKRAIEDDLLRQFEARFEKARNLYHQLFADLGLNFDQAGPWHKQENGVLLPPSDDEDEDASGDGAINGEDDQNEMPLSLGNAPGLFYI